jgi:hypothetical protein
LKIDSSIAGFISSNPPFRRKIMAFLYFYLVGDRLKGTFQGLEGRQDNIYIGYPKFLIFSINLQF